MVEASRGLPAQPLRAERVGDEERQRAAEILADQHAHGRLSPEDFETRLGAAFAAETTKDLGRVLADLPIRAPVVEAPAPRVPQELRWILGGFVAVLAIGILVGVLIETGGFAYWAWGSFWWAFSSPEVLIALISGTIGLLIGRALGRRRGRREAAASSAGH